MLATAPNAPVLRQRSSVLTDAVSRHSGGVIMTTTVETTVMRLTVTIRRAVTDSSPVVISAASIYRRYVPVSQSVNQPVLF